MMKKLLLAQAPCNRHRPGQPSDTTNSRAILQTPVLRMIVSTKHMVSFVTIHAPERFLDPHTQGGFPREGRVDGWGTILFPLAWLFEPVSLFS
jgi:hypothetical protein